MLIDSLLKEAVEEGASDVHLVANLPAFWRVDGILEPIGKKIFSSDEIKDITEEMLDKNQLNRFLTNRDMDLAYELNGGQRFRVNFHWEKGNIGIAARIIPTTIPTLEEVRMPEVIYKMIEADRGLILVTGPTGCGKSTSLAAMINHINENRSANIITLEDPIEFVFQPIKSIIRQRQLGTDMLTFESGLVHALRQDPNVIMVGEMRDLETIATTITLAETGHLVFATLHTYSAAQTIDRIIDIFPPHQQNQIRMQLSLVLRGVISQRLLPKINGGRIAAREILINTPAIANLIRENKVAQIKSIIQTSGREKMITMDAAIKDLFKAGLISKETYELNITQLSKIEF
ncbi:MAG: type IV pilus twitching motility protein PilT [bacterium]